MRKETKVKANAQTYFDTILNEQVSVFVDDDFISSSYPTGTFKFKNGVLRQCLLTHRSMSPWF